MKHPWAWSKNLVSSCQTLNVDHAQLREIIYTGTKSCHRKSNLRNKGQYHLSSEKHVIMIINYIEKKWDSSHVSNNIFSASKNIFFCRNNVQAIDFLRKGNYAGTCKVRNEIKRNETKRRYISFRSVSFRFVLFDFVSFRSISFRFVSISFRTLQVPEILTPRKNSRK